MKQQKNTKYLTKTRIQTSQKTNNKNLEKILYYMRYLGSYQFYIAITIITYAITKNLILFQTLTIGFILMYAIAAPLRLIFFKERPEPVEHHNIIQKINAGSFPSLHSGRSIFILLLSMFLIKNIFITILWTAITILIIKSRIHFKRHRIIDILMGSIIGALSFAISINIVYLSIILL